MLRKPTTDQTESYLRAPAPGAQRMLSGVSANHVEEGRKERRAREENRRRGVVLEEMLSQYFTSRPQGIALIDGSRTFHFDVSVWVRFGDLVRQICSRTSDLEMGRRGDVIGAVSGKTALIYSVSPSLSPLPLLLSLVQIGEE